MSNSMRVSQPVETGSPGSSDGLGLLLTGGPVPVDQWGQAPQAFATLESTGCSAVWLADHLFWGSPMPECLVMASVAAAATTSCGIGTGVLQLPLRRPAVVAKAAATLQAVSGGRFVLGVGCGEHSEEYERAGADFSERGPALDAAIAEIRGLWSQPEDWYGQRPVPTPVPIWVGGRSPRALRRAAESADGWMPMFMTPEGFSVANHKLDERLHRTGRRRTSVARAVVVVVAPNDRRWTRDDALEWMGRLWGTNAARLGRYLITGSAEDCAAGLASYRAVGAEHVVALLAVDDPVEVFVALNGAYQSMVGA